MNILNKLPALSAQVYPPTILSRFLILLAICECACLRIWLKEIGACPRSVVRCDGQENYLKRSRCVGVMELHMLPNYITKSGVENIMLPLRHL
jgi:hypothetical protein